MRRGALAIVIVVVLTGAVLALGVGQRAAHARSDEAQPAQAEPETARQAFQELFELSKAQGKGLMLYVDGQAIPGVVTRVIGDEAVEVRNREYSRIVVRLDEIGAVAAN